MALSPAAPVPDDHTVSSSTIVAPADGGLIVVDEVVDRELELTWGQSLSRSTQPAETVRLGPADAEPVSDLEDAPRRHLRPIGEDPAGGDDYRLEEVLGSGGMGVVYAARQSWLRRQVAVKSIRVDRADQEEAIQRFLTEARVTGALDHPNIVAVHELGFDQDGVPFYTMPRIRGTPWSRVLAIRSRDENLEILHRVCDAVAYAHSRQLLHHDLKPANVMLGEFGEVQVMDWGMAVRLDVPAHERTNSGCTPAYAAPEMARGRRELIGVRSDVYLLGAILFEIVAGRPPHDGRTVRECMGNAARNRIVACAEPSELLSLARWAMATDPGQRPVSVKAFQQSLRDYQSHAVSLELTRRGWLLLAEAARSQDYDDHARAQFAFEDALAAWSENSEAREGVERASESYARCAYDKGDYDLAQSQLQRHGMAGSDLFAAVAAARHERVERFHRWNVLRRALLFLVVVFLAALVVAVVVVTGEKQRALDAEAAAREAYRGAERARGKAARLNYFNSVGLAAFRMERSEFPQGLALLAETSPEHRGWEFGYLQRLAHLARRTLRLSDREIGTFVLDPRRRFLVVAAAAGRHAELRDLADGSVRTRFIGHLASVASLDLATDGSRLATGSWDGHAMLWDTESGESLIAFEGHAGPIADVALSADGEALLTASADGTLAIWDTLTGERRAVFTAAAGPVGAVAWAADGTLVVSGHADGGCRRWRSADGSLVGTWPGPQAVTDVVALDDRVAVARSDGSVRVYAAQGELHWTVSDHRPGAVHLAVSRQRGLLASGGADAVIRLRRLDDGREHLVLRGHTGSITGLGFDRDGDQLATGGADGTVRFWDARERRDRALVVRIDDSVTGLGLGGGDGTVWVSGWDGSVTAVAGGEGRRQLLGDGAVTALATGGDRQLTGHIDGRAVIWDPRGHRQLTLVGHRDKVTAAVLSHGLAVTGGADGLVVCWDLATRSERWRAQPHRGPVTAVAASGDGRLLLTAGVVATEDRLGGGASSLRLWDLATGTAIAALPYDHDVADAVLAADGTWAVTAAMADGTLICWDLVAGSERHRMRGHAGAVRALALDPADKRLASADAGGAVKLWDVASGREVLSLDALGARVNALLFSRDGRDILAGTVTGEVVRWRGGARFDGP